MPIIDDCRAKCTMTTTLEGDSRYTHLISNGNIKEPEKIVGDKKRITYENKIPMAPYLFIACAGTWDVLEDSVGHNGKTIKLEYLVPKGTKEFVKIPMQILKKAITWVKKTQDYEYTNETYRTICMTKSNFGGMENVGNTTIVTDAALINEHTLDILLLYAYAVIVHEFEHNQCGSETTMETPFDIWLNEAYTVHVEQQFVADQFDPTFIRLNKVNGIRMPLLGPLAVEDGGYNGMILREGFNHPDDLIDAVTYVKAAEVIRMLRLILGDDKFKQAKNLYFSRYRHSNANTEQFFECFEEIHNNSLQQFKEGWLSRKGYPKVTVEILDNKITFTQKHPKSGPFHIPIIIGLVDKDGKDISEHVFELKDKKGSFEFDSTPELVSINRDYSFYGTLEYNVDIDYFIKQVKLDPNPFNQVEAMNRLTDIQRIRLMKNSDAEIDEFWLDLIGEIIKTDMPNSLKSRFLTVGEEPLDRDYVAWYEEQVIAKHKMMEAINKKYRPELLDLFNSINTYMDAPLEKGIEDRMLKNVLLSLIVVDDSEDSHKLIIDHFTNATTAQDRVTALILLNRSSCSERRNFLHKTFEEWKGNISGYANYLRVISSGKHDGVFEEMAEEKEKSEFDINHPTYTRALFMPMAMNKEMVWTKKGMQWICDTVIEFSEINTILASRLLNLFQHVRLLKPTLQNTVIEHLQKILNGVNSDDNPTINNQVRAYLESTTP